MLMQPIFILLLSSLLYAEEPPQFSGWVNDSAGVLSSSDKERLTAIITEVEQKTSAEIAIATISSVGDEEYTTYANKLFEAWKIGKKGKDNGVLLFVAVQERKVRIEVGYGLEGILPDGLCGEILDRYVIPDLRRGEYGHGLLNGTAVIAMVIARDAGVEISQGISGTVPKSGQGRSGRNIVQLLSVLAAVIFFFGASSVFNIGRSGRRRRGGWYGGIGTPWGGFGGGGSFGGGFGGFGGGMSGGGGAGRGF